MNKKITVETEIDAPVEKVWEFWTAPKHITQWNFASDDWECPSAENDVRVGGKFKARMSSKDGNEGFDFEGTYTNVKENKLIEYEISDGRKVEVKFIPTSSGTKVSETFDIEHENPEELQRGGWQSILNNFKKYVEEN